MPLELRRWQLTNEIPKGVSIGRSSSGAWATSELKEYPPALCGGLASDFMHSLSAHSNEPEVEPVSQDVSFRQLAMSMVVTSAGECIGPDYAPRGCL